MLNAYFMGPGGSHYVVLEMAIAFAEKGYDVYVDSITTKSRRDLEKFAEFFGVNHSELEGINVGKPPNKPLLTINASGDVLSGSGDVLYLHYPSLLDCKVYYPGLSGISQLLGNMYSFINTALFPLIKNRIKLYIANSKFTASFLREVFSIDSIIVNPPVNLDDVLDKPVLDFAERDRRVLVVARISPEKHPERAVYLAYLLRKHRIHTILVGVLSSRNKPLYDELVNMATKLNIDDYFEIKTNVSRRELVELYRTSLLYVHVTPREHFGISIVEAMAAGTPVILPRDSGSWIDIALENSRIALPYCDLKEARCHVLALQNNPELWRILSVSGRLRALELDRRNFRKKIFEVVKPLIKS